MNLANAGSFIMDGRRAIPESNEWELTALQMLASTTSCNGHRGNPPLRVSEERMDVGIKIDRTFGGF